MINRPESIGSKESGKHLLVVGDFMIDRAWILSGSPSVTSQSHADVIPMKRIFPARDDERPGGAGSSLAALRALCQITNSHYHIHGIGVWEQKDDQLLRRLVGEAKTEEGTRDRVELHRLNVKNEKDIVTIVKARFYLQLADERPRLVARYDQDPDRPPIFSEKPLENLDLPSPMDIQAVLVADFDKGTVQKSVLSALREYIGDNKDCLWLVDSKRDDIYDLLPDELRVQILTMNREETVRLASRLGGRQEPSIPSGNQASIELLSRLEDIIDGAAKKKKVVQWVVLKLDRDGACACNHNGEKIILVHPRAALSSAGISAGDYFNASLLLGVAANADNTEISQAILRSACATAANWLAFTQEYWISDLGRKYSSDIVRADIFASESDSSVLNGHESDWSARTFDLTSEFERMLRPFHYAEIVQSESNDQRLIDLSDAKGFLGEFISTDRILRSNIREFVNSIRDYTQSVGATRPLNCLVVAKPGSGKSFFAKQVAIETNCDMVEVDCSQVVSGRDLLESIARLQNVREGRVPLLFIDEVDWGRSILCCSHHFGTQE